MDTATAYLAGPMVFYPDAAQVFARMKETCAQHGLVGIAPVDGDLDLFSLPLTERAAAIRAGNIEKIIACDVVIACIRPFRGPGADAGTAWEMGYAEALGKPVVAWTDYPGSYIERVPNRPDGTGNPVDRGDMAVEDFGLSDNLMLTAGAIPVQATFEDAVKMAVSAIRAHR